MATLHARPRPTGAPKVLVPLLTALLLATAPATAQRVVSTRVTANAFGTAVIGLIENDAPHGVDVVRLSVTLLDASGEPLARQTGVPDVRVLAPGERSAFTVQSMGTSRPDAAAAAMVDLTVRPAEAPPEALEVRGVRAEPSRAGTRVTGTVANVGEAPLAFIKVSATALGPNDAILATSVYYENLRTLAPGASMPFTVLVPGLLEAPTDWLVRAYDGRSAP